MTDTPLRVIPLGGLGEVGKNMMAIEYGEHILVIDTGLMFPENDMLGIDYIIPDFQYLLDKRARVTGIIITHGHEDHTGAVHHILEQINAPIYATALTRGLVEIKLARGGLINQVKLNTIRAGSVIPIGPFQVETYHVCHSIPDGLGLGINTPAGLIIHSGDYKFDHTPVDNWPTDYAKLGEFSGRGVLALLSDSTNAERSGWTPSERVMDPAFDQVFRTAQGRIIFATFASVISRMQQVGNVAARYGRKMAFVGASMNENARMARKLGYLDLPDDLVVSAEQALKMKDSQVVLMCTGSQGEPSSILGRLSTGSNRQFDIQAGDTVVLSSHPIPGNEENVYRTINRLFRRGANVIYNAIAPVHVSGHASQEEQKLLINLVRPKYFIPIHGELRHLHRHAGTAREMGIPPENVAVIENGQIVEFRSGEMRMAERIPGGYVFVDGSSVGDIGPQVVRERESLARDGIVLINVTLDRFENRLAKEVEIITRGFIHTRDGDDLIASLQKFIAEAVRVDDGDPQDKIQQVVKTYIYGETKRRPTIFVLTNRA